MLTIQNTEEEKNARNNHVATASAKALLSQSVGLPELCRVLPLQPVFLLLCLKEKQ